jgi:YidC/Oxa1 family membrane protein insertase
MERNAILATVLVILILVGYQWYLSRLEAPPQEPARPTTTTPPAQPTAAPTSGAPSVPPAKLAKALPRPPTRDVRPVREVVVETPLIRVRLSTAGAQVTSWQLKKYRVGDGAPVDLVAAKDSGGSPGPLSAWADGQQAPEVYEVDRERLDLSGPGATGTVTFTNVAPSGLELQKKLTFYSDRYEAKVDLTVRNPLGADAPAEPQIIWGPGLRNSLDKKHSTLQVPTLWVDGNRVHEDLSKLNGEKVITGSLSWVALQDTYFTAALVPDEKGLQAFVKKAAEDQPMVGLEAVKQVLPPGSQTSALVLVYAGPKDLDILKSVGHNLDQIVDLGMFDKIYLVTAALWLLKFLYRFIGNYGIAIILVTVLQKIAFHPLTVKSLRSMRAMQEIQPKVQAIQERYKNNPQKKQEETMALYRKYGVNPMGGCLPMLVQIPIFIALYNALSSSVEMWQAHFLWIRDLTQPDSLFTLTVWGGYEFHANVLALLMGISMWVQQKMSPPAGDPRQAQMMLWMMPILFTFMFWNFPSGLVLYWLVNNVLQVGQQWLITRSPARPAPAEGQAA